MTLATQTSTNPYSGKQPLFQIAARTTVGSPEKLRQQYDEEEVLAWIQTVPPEVYWFERRQQEQREERERWLRRLRNHPSRALAQVDVQFHQLLHNLKR